MGRLQMYFYLHTLESWSGVKVLKEGTLILGVF